MYVAAGDYQLTLPDAQFSGFNLHSYTTLRLTNELVVASREVVSFQVTERVGDHVRGAIV